MTKEQIEETAERVVAPMQWLTPEEEWLVMEAVARKMRERRQRESGADGNPF